MDWQFEYGLRNTWEHHSGRSAIGTKNYGIMKDLREMSYEEREALFVKDEEENNHPRLSFVKNVPHTPLPGETPTVTPQPFKPEP